MKFIVKKMIHESWGTEARQYPIVGEIFETLEYGLHKPFIFTLWLRGYIRIFTKKEYAEFLINAQKQEERHS